MKRVGWILVLITVLVPGFYFPFLPVRSEVHFGPIQFVEEEKQKLDRKVYEHWAETYRKNPNCGPNNPFENIRSSANCPIPGSAWSAFRGDLESFLGYLLETMSLEQLIGLMQLADVNEIMELAEKHNIDLREVAEDVIPEPTLVDSFSSISPTSTTAGDENDFTARLRIAGLQAVDSNHNEVTVRLTGFGESSSDPVAETIRFDTSDIQAGLGADLTISGGDFDNLVAPDAENSPYPVEVDVDFRDPDVPDIEGAMLGKIKVTPPDPALVTTKSRILPAGVITGNHRSYRANVVLKNLNTISADENIVKVRLENFESGTGSDVSDTTTFDASSISPGGTTSIDLKGEDFANVTAPTPSHSPYAVSAEVDFSDSNVTDIDPIVFDDIKVYPTSRIDTGESRIQPTLATEGLQQSYEATVAIKNLGFLKADNNEVTVRLVNFQDGTATDIVQTTTFDAADVTPGGTVTVNLSGGNFTNLAGPSASNSPYAVRAEVDYTNPDHTDLGPKTIDHIRVSPPPAVDAFNSSITPKKVTEGTTNSYDAEVHLENLQPLKSSNNLVSVELVHYLDGTSTSVHETTTFDTSDVDADSSAVVVVSGGNFSNLPAPPANNSPYSVIANVNFSDPELSDLNGVTIDQAEVTPPQPAVDTDESNAVPFSSPVVEGEDNTFRVGVKLENLNGMDSDNNQVTVRFVNYADGTSTDVVRSGTFDESDVTPQHTANIPIVFSGIESPSTANSPYAVKVDVDFTDGELNNITGAKIDEISVHPP